MNAKLTATQTTVLKAAAARPDGNIEPLPTNLRGGAKAAVIDGLLARALITKFQHPRPRRVLARMQKMLKLARLAPDMVEEIARGRQPVGLSLLFFVENPLPEDWNEQREVIGGLAG